MSQAIFDQVAKHLLTQKRRASHPEDKRPDGSPKCMYRAPNGDKCAAGCLIKDEHYSPGLENWSAHTNVVRGAIEKSVGTGVDIGLVTRLQSIHDWEPIETWKEHLRGVASQYMLNSEVLNGL
jgi:hypothetical protein